MANDQELLRLYRETGDVDAFVRLIGRYAGLVYSAALRVTRNAEDAEDTAQEVFLTLAHKTDGIPQSFPAWLHRLAVNRALDLMRGEDRRRRREYAAERLRRDQRESPSGWDKVGPYVDEAMDALAEELRETLILHFLHGCTQADVAKRMGVDQSTVSRRIHTGLESLRTRLGKMGMVLSAAALLSLLESYAGAAVPAGLVAALAQTAPIGGFGGVGATAGSATVAKTGASLGGMGVMKLSLIGLVAASAITVGVVQAVRSADREGPPAPRPSAVAPVAAQVSASAQPRKPAVPREALLWALAELNFWRLTGDIVPSVTKALAYEEMQPFLWGETPPRETASLIATFHSDVPAEGPVLLAFFQGKSWAENPVQLRRVGAEGVTTVANLAPGEYWIAALCGDPAKPDLLGVHETWPELVNLREGEQASPIAILLSSRVAKNTSWWGIGERSKPAAGEIDPKKIVLGYVTGPEGSPEANVLIQIREVRKPGQSGISAPDAVTDEDGYYFWSGIEWPYRLGALRYTLAPGIVCVRHQYIGLPEVHDRPEEVDFAFSEFPEGAGVVKGRLVDDAGEPVSLAMVNIRTETDGSERENKILTTYGYRIAVLLPDGSFELRKVADGDYSAQALCHGEYAESPFQKFSLNEGGTVDVTLTLEKLTPRFVRIVNAADGKPVPRASLAVEWNRNLGYAAIQAPGNSDDNGLLRAMLSRDELEQLARRDTMFIVAGGYLIYEGPVDALAETPEQAGTVRLQPMD